MKVSEYLILLIFVIVFIGSLSLGIWQIDRGYDKKALENTFSQRQSLPVKTNPGELNQNLYYRNIQISGIFGKKNFFVEIGSNDGSFLKIINKKVKCLGIDPSKIACDYARKKK